MLFHRHYFMWQLKMCWFWRSSVFGFIMTSFHVKVGDKVSGCGSVGRAVAYDSRGPRFDSSYQQNFIEHLFIFNCIEKKKINKKRPGMAHFFLKNFF